jgi:CHAT domain-containing protein
MMVSTVAVHLEKTSEIDKNADGTPRSLDDYTEMEHSEQLKSKSELKDGLLASYLLSGSSRLTVSNIFAMDLSKAHPVVCSIACDSGVQEISLRDEPLGLVSALFCAGASSVVGTLWPIRSSTGLLFTKAFYQNLKEQVETQDTERPKDAQRVLNLANAMRYATLAVKESKPDPYSWTSFVLQGAGFYFFA